MRAAWRSAVVQFVVQRLERELPRVERVLRRLGIDVVGPAEAPARPSRRQRLEVVKISRSTVVVNQPRLGPQARLAREKLLSSYLATAHIVGVLERYRVNCVIDVGGNRGHYGRMLRAAGYTGHIVSFEPVAHLFEELARAARNDPKWAVHRLALGTEDGVTSMHVVPETTKGWRAGLSSVLPPTSYGAQRYRVLSELSTEEVTLRRLDGLMQEVTAGMPDLRLYLKLDTQGYDLRVFEGLGERAADVVAMQSEMALAEMYESAPSMTQALETYVDAGFSVSGLFLVSRNWSSWSAVEYDCVMVRESALLD
jgi:FkbM family methyltransferase